MRKVICTNFDKFDKTKHWFRGSINNREYLKALFKDLNKTGFALDSKNGVYYYNAFIDRIDMKPSVIDIEHILFNKNVSEFKFEFKEIVEFDRDKHYVIGLELAKKVGLVGGYTWKEVDVIYYLNGLRKASFHDIPLLKKAGYTEYKEH